MLASKFYINQLESIKYPFSAEDFNLSYWRSKEDSHALSGGRGASQKIRIEDQHLVLRHYLRGGVIARFLYDQYVWTGLENSRPYQEKKVIQHALKHHLPVPEVIAFCLQRTGLFYRASIISRYIQNQGTLAGWLYEHALTEQQWRALGALIKRLHAAHIYHADLNANNILVDANGQFSLIDFDKAQIKSPLGSVAEENIQRLLRSLKKIQHARMQQQLTFNFEMSQWQYLLKGYR